MTKLKTVEKKKDTTKSIKLVSEDDLHW